MTGRAAGYCAGYNMPGYANPYGGRMGAGFGRGRGRGGGYFPSPAVSAQPYGAYPYAPTYSEAQEKETLQNQVKFFEDQIGALQKRIEELESETSKK
jgi:hypothetical protein